MTSRHRIAWESSPIFRTAASHRLESLGFTNLVAALRSTWVVMVLAISVKLPRNALWPAETCGETAPDIEPPARACRMRRP